MANNEIIVDEDELPTPEERADLANEQENVREMIRNTIGELNTYLAHASQIGMVVEMQEHNLEEIGVECPRKVITVIRATAVVGYRRPK